MEKITSENIITEVVHEGYLKSLEELEDGSWEAKFINTVHDVVLFETIKPLKSTASSMVGSFINKFDYIKDKDRGVPKRKLPKGGKNFSGVTSLFEKEQAKRDPLAIPKRLEVQRGDSYTKDINGVLVHFISTQWASTYKFCHKSINYSLDIDWTNEDQIEIYFSNTDDYLLGSNYTKDHIPKLAKWLKDGIYQQIKKGLYTEDDDIHHPETPNKYKNRMLIWMLHNYDVMCSKGV